MASLRQLHCTLVNYTKKFLQYFPNNQLLSISIITLIYIIHLYIYLTYTFQQVLLLFTALCLKQLGKELKIDLKSYEGLIDVTFGLRQYRILAETVEYIGIHWGGQLVAFCVCSVSFYILLPYLLFSADKSHGSKIELLDFILTLLVWINGAEFHYLV